MTAGDALPVVWHPDYEIDIGAHVFPTRKYRLVKDRLVADGTIAAADIRRPTPATDAEVALVHTEAYLAKLRAGRLPAREEAILEIPYTPEIRDGMWLCTGGSILTARLSLERGVAVHLGGGFHHAFADHGEGFCVLNDVAVAIRVMMRDAGLERALVVDLDVHHGNGTAAIFAHDASVFTFSMHQQDNYPAWKPPSDLDIGLEDGTGDAEYLELLGDRLPRVIDRHRPALAFYLAGADPYEHDLLGGLALTLDGLRARDRLVLQLLRAHDVAAAVVLAGGYAVNTDDTVAIHCGTVREAAARGAPDPPAPV